MLEGCAGSANSSKLLRETCHWQCKFRRPFMRCLWQFDPTGELNLRGRLNKCWMSEKCSNETTEGVSVTCQAEPDSLIVVHMQGSFRLQVAGTDGMSNTSLAYPALGQAIASMLDGVSADMVQITSVVKVGRRLNQGQSGQPQVLNVTYTIVAAAPIARAASQKMKAVTAANLSAAVQSALQASNLTNATATLQVQEKSELNSVSKETPTLQAVQQEMGRVMAMKQVTEAHLKEVIADLNQTRSEMENTSKVHNLTRQVLDAASQAHEAAKQQLARINHQQQQLLSRLRAALVNTNESKASLAAAELLLWQRQVDHDTAQRWLNTSQESLQRATSNLAQSSQMLQSAVADPSSSAAHIEQVNATYLTSAAQSKAAQEQVSLAEQRLRSATSAVLLAEQNVTAAAAQLQMSRQATIAAQNEQQALEDSLSSVNQKLQTVRDELRAAILYGNQSGAALYLVKMDLARALHDQKRIQQELEAERQAHNKTQQQLLNEQQAHKETKDQQEMQRGLLIALIGGVVFLSVVVFVLLFLVLRYRRRWLNCAIRSASPGQPAAAGDQGPVVVGRPVGGSSNAPNNKTPSEGTDKPPSKDTDKQTRRDTENISSV